MFTLNYKIPIIVAEISSNHCQDFANAVKLIQQAKSNGASAVKFQAYTADSLTINMNNKYFRIEHEKWGGQKLYDLYSQAATPWEWLKELKKTSEDLGMLFLCTSFDKKSADLLESLNILVHKISSFELNYLSLVEYVASTKKPLILSTGMSTINQITEAVQAAKAGGCKELILLKCTSSYPADPSDINLKTIPHMKDFFNCLVGLSDHTMGISVSLAAIALGADIIEKHFTLNRGNASADSFFSIEPNELRQLTEGASVVSRALGKVSYDVTGAENSNVIFRRSIFAIQDINPGNIFDTNNLGIIRPGYGLQPKYLKHLLGKVSRTKINRGTPITWDLII